ncbi:MAG: hypothetical protein JOZ16_04465 [Methylobacteriaceae bacterium]|nr:hypothetical protein [Methylobacteriaceae bacterium]
MVAVDPAPILDSSQNSSPWPEPAAPPRRTLLLLGIPHPVTHAVVRYIEALLGGLPAEAAYDLALVTSVKTSWPAADVTIYLRPEAIDGLALPASRWLRPPAEQRLQTALLRRLDARWGDQERLSLESVLNDEHWLPATLAHQLSVAWPHEALTAARESYRALREDARAYGDPIGFLSGVDPETALAEIVGQVGRDYAVLAGEEGAEALLRGWKQLEATGAGLSGRRGVLGLVTPSDARTLVLRWELSAGAPRPHVRIGGMAPPCAWRSEGGTAELAIALPNGGKGGPLAIDLLAAPPEGRSDVPLLLGFRLLAETTAPAAVTAEPDSVPLLLGAGFDWRCSDEEVATCANADDHWARLFRRGGAMHRVVVIGAAPPTLPRKGLFAVMPLDEAGWTASLPEEGMLCRPLGPDGLPPDLCEAEIDLIYLHKLRRHPALSSLLGWIMDTLPSHGIFAGREASPEDADHVVAALARDGIEEGLVVTLEGAAWTAIPRGCWIV